MEYRWRWVATALAAIIAVNAAVVVAGLADLERPPGDVVAEAAARPEATAQAATPPAGPQATPPAAPAATATFDEGAMSVADEADVPTLADLYAGLGLSVSNGPVDRAGCPPPPAGGGGGGGAGGGEPSPLPSLVPEDRLPAPAPLIEWTSQPDPAAGKGMWLWQYTKTEGNDADAIVTRAVDAGLDHVWVRVGDSRDGFYAAKYLEPLLPRLHDAGIKVIGWGFPFLHDPMYDVAWSVEAIDYRTSDGHGLDGYSADIETSSEGVVLTPARVEVYLSHLRSQVGDFPLPTTVYPPVDWVWESDYPFEEMAPYIDSYVPMDYWECGDAGYLVRQSIQRLGDLRPVHVIGQGYGNCCRGRRPAPSTAETLRFFDVAVREGAIGASLWVWQLIGDEQWDAMASYPWADAVASHSAHPTTPEYASD